MKNYTRQINYDILRIASAVSVVFIHVNAYYFKVRYINGVYDSITVIEQIINFISRFSVPCFVMLSGAFSLNNSKNEDISYYYRKIFKKIVFPYTMVLTVWFVLYAIKYIIFNKDYLGYIEFFIKLSPGNLWFMPMIICLYLLTPYLQKMINCFNNKEYFIVVIVFMVWAVISQMTTDSEFPYNISVVMSYLSYYLLGGYLKKYDDRKRLKTSWVIIILIITVIIGCSSRIYFGNAYPYYLVIPPFTNFFDPFIVLYSICIFYLCGFFTWKCNSETLMSNIANNAFYIYMFHTPVWMILQHILRGKVIINEVLTIFVCSLIVFFLSALVSAFFRLFYNKISNIFF